MFRSCGIRDIGGVKPVVYEKYNHFVVVYEIFAVRKKTNSRKSLQTGGSFTATDALIKIKTKRINEAKDELKKAERLLQDSIRRALRKHKRAGIDARKAGREFKDD